MRLIEKKFASRYFCVYLHIIYSLKVKMKRLAKIGLYAATVFIATTGGIFAQPPPPEEIPIDGGTALLLGAGVAYGIKKYRDYRKTRKQ
jgi:hypothetical protein